MADFESDALPDFSVEPGNVQEAKFRWIFLGCADHFTLVKLQFDLIRLNKPFASDLAAALEDMRLQFAEITAKDEREQMKRARAAFTEYPFA